MATYRELKAQAQKILDEAEKKRVEEMGQALASIVATIKEFEISEAELLAYLRKKGLVQAATSSSIGPTERRASSPVKPKYRDPATGTTWSGRGRMPVWLSDAVKAGKSKDAFLIAD